MEMDKDLQNVAITVRSSDGDGGQEYILRGNDMVKAAAMQRQLPVPVTLNRDGAV